MTEKKDVTKQESKAALQAKQNAQAMTPAVDIYEDATGITLYADMPGVPKDRLNIRVDKDTLFIEGDVSIDMPEDVKALYADVIATRYQRSFLLSSELDPSKVGASIKDGLLTLHIPKREEHKPRKIEVRAG